MDGGRDRRAGAPGGWICARASALIGAAIMLAFAVTACTSTSTPAPTLASASGRGPIVAFESVDGPPESIYAKLVRSLSEEAEARRIAVVSRSSPAHYRVRVYAANVVYPKRSVVYWVWDVYDGNQQRVYRASGEEPIIGAGRNTWAATDDQVIRRIARTGMDRLVAFLGAPAREPALPASPPPAEAPAVAMAAEH
jgi:hypothetical protein